MVSSIMKWGKIGIQFKVNQRRFELDSRRKKGVLKLEYLFPLGVKKDAGSNLKDNLTLSIEKGGIT